EPITLEEVSAAIGFSVNYFSTLFKKETGEGFAKYLTHVRMDEARALLRDTNQPVAEICKSIGYGDLKHFTRTFKAEVGLTPGEYRKLYG
ncbi:MAG: helix-turn-helix transcriptional regulator, partial [Candidatus Limiplasma sp.]|nr:helix-turn-helix transcriptional regulator [Candidatus Limiplasma sp.]